MQHNHIPLYSTFQPSMAYRLRHSRALMAILAVLGVTVMALAGALVVNRSDAQQGVPSAAKATPSKLVADTSKAASPSTAK